MRTPPRFTKLDDKHHITTHNLSTTPGRPPAHHHSFVCAPHSRTTPLLPGLGAPCTRSPLTCWPLLSLASLVAEKKGTKRAADGKAKKAESSSEEEEESDEEESSSEEEEEEEEVRGGQGLRMDCQCPLLARTSLQGGPCLNPALPCACQPHLTLPAPHLFLCSLPSVHPHYPSFSSIHHRYPSSSSIPTTHPHCLQEEAPKQAAKKQKGSDGAAVDVSAANGSRTIFIKNLAWAATEVRAVSRLSASCWHGSFGDFGLRRLSVVHHQEPGLGGHRGAPPWCWLA